jgi:hypothetical protein
MDLALLWMAAILVMALLGWLACSRFWSYYALFKHLVWGSLALLLGFASYDYGVYRGAWAVRDAYQEAQEARDVNNPSNDNSRNNSYAAQEDARVPFLDETIVAGFLMYCVLMLLVGGQIVNNSARRTAMTVERDSLLDKDNPRLSR